MVQGTGHASWELSEPPPNPWQLPVLMTGVTLGRRAQSQELKIFLETGGLSQGPALQGYWGDSLLPGRVAREEGRRDQHR